MFISICDILGATLTIVSLFLTSKSYKAWALYSFACIPFTIVGISKQLPGYTVMGILLFIIGIKNFIMGRKHEKR